MQVLPINYIEYDISLTRFSTPKMICQIVIFLGIPNKWIPPASMTPRNSSKKVCSITDTNQMRTKINRGKSFSVTNAAAADRHNCKGRSK